MALQAEITLRKGDRYSFYGQLIEIVRVSRDGRKVTTAEVSCDSFGKEYLVAHREWHVASLKGYLRPAS